MKNIYLLSFSIFCIISLFSTNIFSQQNPDFDSKLQHWVTSGTAFNNQPEFGNTVRTYRVRPEISDSIGGDYWRGLPHSIGHHGNYWITSYNIQLSDSILSNDSLCNFSMGSLTSEIFTLTSDTISFLLGGNGGKVELWIQREDIYIAPLVIINDSILFENYIILDEKIPKNEIEVLGREFFVIEDIERYLKKNAIIRIVDSSESEHINVDDFYFSENEKDDIIEYKFRTSFNKDSNNFKDIKYFKNRDINLPLWGFADTHGHWMNHEAFGVDFIFGKPYGNIDTALQNCKDNYRLHNKPFNLFFSKFHEGVENSGYPEFESWPKFNDILHQTMYIDWVRRAYLGGLRLIVCPMGNNTNLPRLMGSNLNQYEYSDTLTVFREVKYLDTMINILKKEGWIDIAESSDEAIKLMMENKLVIIKGMEVDQPGGFLYLDSTKAETNFKKIENYVNFIYDTLGIRHMFPIHHCDNAFGGFSLYGTEFFSMSNYHLKNTLKDEILQEDKYVKIESSSLTSFRLGSEKNSKYKSVTLGKIPLGSLLVENSYYRPPGSGFGLGYNGISDYSKFALGMGHVNVKGLTPSGKELLKIMMRKGMLFDLDHMSMKSTNDALNIIEDNKIELSFDTLFYPALAGHTNFLEQQFNSNETSECENCLQKLKNEHAKTNEMLDKLKRFGGMISPLTEGDKDVQSKLFKGNENPGSSKSWAEAYIFALNNFGLKNIGLGTDMNGLVTQISPRFGTNSAYSLRDDTVRINRLGSRRQLAYLQSNGVKYKTNLKDCKKEKFNGKDVFNKEQTHIWQTIYAAHSQYGFNLESKYIKMLEGFKLGIDSILNLNIKSKKIKLSEIKIAAYIVAMKYEHNQLINKNPFYKKYDSAKIKKWIDKIDPIYRNYSQTIGDNIPITRCEIQTTDDGIKDFDFNIDGLAHYGLFPDFMQDLKNIGLSYNQLTVLFNSAGDFADMLKRCENFSELYSKK